MKVVFFGNHDVGIAALKILNTYVEVVGVVAHPMDPEEGSRFASVYEFALENRLRVIRGRGKDPAVLEFVRDLSPDLAWVTDYRYILPNQIFSIPKLGSVNLHPSLLPKYRGRAPINWAILRGETQIGLSAHFIDDGVDTGDIIKQVAITLNSGQDVGDALKALMPLYQTLTKDVIDFFRSGNVPRQVQILSKGSIFPARTPEDGRIDWSKSATDICNLVRAVSHPYPGAFSQMKMGRIYVWKASVSDLSSKADVSPGSIIGLGKNNQPKIQCGNGILEIINWTSDTSSAEYFRIGERFL